MHMRQYLGVTVCLAVAFLLVVPCDAVVDVNSIVGIWLLDEGDGIDVRDLSALEHHGTIAGEPEWVDGRSKDAGTALTFDGVDDHVDCGNTEDMNLDIFSVSFWVNIPVTQGWNHIVSRGSHKGGGNPGAVNWGVMMVDASAEILFEVFNNTGWKGLRAPIKTETWHHVVATYDGQEQIQKLYLDGVERGANQAVGILLEEARPLILGAKSDSGGATSLFNGTVDEVGYFSTILSLEQIEEIMNEGLVNATGLLPVSPHGKIATTWAAVRN